MRIIYIFIDGIGLGRSDPDANPFTRYAHSFLAELGGLSARKHVPDGWGHAITDAHLGVSGLPQSATGQTALWTGVNGPQTMGHHKNGFPGPTLIDVIRRKSIVKQVVDAGGRASLLNAYGEQYLERIRRHPRLTSASTHVQLASGQPLKSLEDLGAGRALYMDITHEIMHRFFPESIDLFPIRDPYERGCEFAEMCRNYDLALFEYFLTDKAGHEQSFDMARLCIETLEAFLCGVTDAMHPAEELLLLTSDHGNLEDLSTKSHTHNFVPTFTYGLGAEEARRQIKCLTDIPALIAGNLNLPDIEPAPPGAATGAGAQSNSTGT